MSQFFIEGPLAGSRTEIDFPAFVELVKGASITSALAADSYVELGLSESLMLRLHADGEGRVITSIFSTLNSGEVPPIRVRLIGDEEEPAAALVEQRLHAMRQAFAITFLLQEDRGAELESVLKDNPSADLEQELLAPEDRLYLQAAGPGSFWVTVLTKSKTAGDAALIALSSVYDEGRQLLLRRVRAGTELKELEVQAKRDALTHDRLKWILDFATRLEKIKNVDQREAARQILVESAKNIRPDIAGLLPPPKP